MGLKLEYRKFDEPERMLSIVEEHMSRKAKVQGAIRTGGLLTAVSANTLLKKHIPKSSVRIPLALALGSIGGLGFGALQRSLTDRKIRTLHDPDAKHFKLTKTSEERVHNHHIYVGLDKTAASPQDDMPLNLRLLRLAATHLG